MQLVTGGPLIGNWISLSCYSANEEHISQVDLQIVFRIVVVDRWPGALITPQSSYLRIITQSWRRGWEMFDWHPNCSRLALLDGRTPVTYFTMLAYTLYKTIQFIWLVRPGTVINLECSVKFTSPRACKRRGIGECQPSSRSYAFYMSLWLG